MLCLAGVQQLLSLGLWHKQLHIEAGTSPAALVGWVQEHGGSVEGVNVQPAGGGVGYGLWSTKVPSGCSPIEAHSVSGMHFHMQMQELKPGACLVQLPKQCQLTYDSQSQPELLELIEQVPAALWGARLALQVCDLPAS